MYAKLIGRLNQLAGKSFGMTFVALRDAERVQVVETLSSKGDSPATLDVSSQDLFGIVADDDLFRLSRSHCLQGYLSEPEYGGNRDYTAWESIGHICHFNYPKKNPACESGGHG